MASLTEISFFARKGIKWGIIGLIVIMITPVVWRAILAKLPKKPEPPAPPTLRYGKLPPLQFPSQPEKVLEYKLETITGALPTDLPLTSRVYIAGINRSRLVSLDRIRNIAKTLGFSTEVLQLDEQNYKFVHPRLPAELLFNIITWQFAYRYDWTSDPSVYEAKTRQPQLNSAIGEARNYMQGIGLLSGDLANGPAKARYYTATGSALIPTESFYDANFTRVDIFRADKDKLKVLTAGGDEFSPVNVLISGLGGEKHVAQANYYYSMTVDNDFATYPLKGIQKAYDELVNGQGHIAKQAGEKITVRKASLAYYESNEPQQFLQPVYIFEGDGNFMGIVQAVDDGYIEKPAPTPTNVPINETQTIESLESTPSL